MHQVIGDMLRTHNIHEYNFDEIDPWGDILQTIACSICTTHHRTSKGSTGQLVFGRDKLFNIPYTPNWKNLTSQ